MQEEKTIPPKSKVSKYLFINFRTLSCNAAGLKNKIFSLSKVINDLEVSLFCIQETHYLQESQVKFENDSKYQLFEKLRESKSNGGLLIGALKKFNPIWVNDG